MIDLKDVATPKARHDLATVKDRLPATAGDWLPGKLLGLHRHNIDPPQVR